MLGIWQGQYWFNNHKGLPEVLKNRKTNFNLEIIHFDNTKFSGIVQDDLETGGTPGIGTITGAIEGNKISFVKKMPVKTVIFSNGESKILKGKHPYIYYSGTCNSTTQILTGNWKIKFGIHWIGIIPTLLFPINGEWVARKYLQK